MQAGGESTEPWQMAMTTMAGAVTQLVTAMTEQREASVLKWERKRPTIRMEGAEAYMHEMVALENAFAELGAKSFRRRWAIFRPSLEGRAKETVEVELERRDLTAEKIAKFTEEQYQLLYQYLIAYMEQATGLMMEKKANIALAAVAKVSMAEGSGPAGAEKLVADYKHAYLLELRAKLVENTEIALTKRLFEFQQKMAPEVRSYVKGLPPREVPDTLEGMYEAIRRWCDKERAASDGSMESRWTRRRPDRVYENSEGRTISRSPRRRS